MEGDLSNHATRRPRLAAAIAAAMLVMTTAVPADAEPAPSAAPPLSAADSDPARLGWMQGSPPPADKQIRFADGSYFTFPKTRWSFAHFRELVPTARISRGTGPIAPLPEALRPDIAGVTFVPTGGHQPVNWVTAFDGIYGDAVLVLHKGRIVYERYNGVMNRDQPHIAFSLTKSFFGTLGEMMIESGELDDRQTVAHYLPELAHSGFANATVRQVMDMTTGLDYDEDYASPRSAIVKFGTAVGIMPAPPGYSGPQSSAEYLPTIAAQGRHGDRFDYQSVDTEVLAWIMARIAGKPAHQLLEERIFSKLGAEHDAAIVIDRNGMGFAAGGLNLTLRDLARFAEMIRNQGRFNGQQIVPAKVVERLHQGASRADFAKAGYDTMPGWSYRSQWWVTHDAHGVLIGRGIHGQMIYIDPVAEMVAVRFMSNPVASTATFDAQTLPAFAAVADHLMASR
ncbi:MAG: serine hydrolase [Proteobacteria bacterium]|nr:serine hydrolase [Pseudomonadota bacterium]